MFQPSLNCSVKDSNVMSINAITSPCSRGSKINKIQDTYRCYAPSKALVPKLPSPNELLASPTFNNAAASHETHPSNHRFEGNNTILENDGDFLYRQGQTQSLTSTSSLTDASTPDNTNISAPHTPEKLSVCIDTYSTNEILAENGRMDHSYDNVSQLRGNKRYFAYDSSSNAFKSDFYNSSSAKSHLKDVNSRKKRDNKVEKVIATRRANNRVASAKYRAKKQALTQALQDRIIYLATQVMYLENELSLTKARENQTSHKYKKLQQEH